MGDKEYGEYKHRYAKEYCGKTHATRQFSQIDVSVSQRDRALDMKRVLSNSISTASIAQRLGLGEAGMTLFFLEIPTKRKCNTRTIDELISGLWKEDETKVLAEKAHIPALRDTSLSYTTECFWAHEMNKGGEMGVKGNAIPRCWGRPTLIEGPNETKQKQKGRQEEQLDMREKQGDKILEVDLWDWGDASKQGNVGETSKRPAGLRSWLT